MLTSAGASAAPIWTTPASATGTVTSVATGTGLTGGPITTTGTIAIDNTVATLTGTQTLTNKTIQGGAITLETAVASTSGTSIDFTGIPSWVKKITLMLSGVSTNGNANIYVQIGSGSVETSGYVSVFEGSTASGSATAAFIVTSSGASDVRYGTVVLNTMGSNLWVASSIIGITNATLTQQSAGAKTTSGVLDRIRLTTSNGTDTFDAGSVNILYEG